MRKLILLFVSIFVIGNIFAQKSLQTMAPTIQKQTIDNSDFRIAEGDTVFYFDCNYMLMLPEENMEDFTLSTEDFDEQIPAAYQDPSDELIEYTSSFFYDYESLTGSSDPIIPNGTLEVDWDPNPDPSVLDTAWHFAAFSWFTNPAVAADNWLGMGPISIPESGAEFKFHHRSRQDYIDGFDVYFTTGGMEPYNDVDPGETPVAYSRDSYTSNDPKFSASDTIWTERTVSMNDFAGEDVYITFHHNAPDMEVLRLDNFLILESDNMSINDKEDFDVNIFPNPSNGVFTVTSNTSDIKTIEVVNILGEVIDSRVVEGKINETFDMTSFSAGMYFVKSSDGTSESTQRIIIK